MLIDLLAGFDPNPTEDPIQSSDAETVVTPNAVIATCRKRLKEYDSARK